MYRINDSVLQSTNNLINRMRKIGIIPVIKLEQTDKAQDLANALMAGGVACAEVTFRASGADKVIKTISTNFPNMLVGAGTVTTINQVDLAVSAGAHFCVAPGFNPNIVEHCTKQGVPFIPGVSTCSEIERAMEMGLPAVKFFPAEQAGGLPFLKAVCSAYSDIVFMPTGGISQNNMLDYLSFNRVFCCGGSFLTPATAIANGDFNKITEICRSTREIINK